MHSTFQWQYANSTHLPGGSQSVAHQFIRCVLHQLAPNGVFVQMFLTQSNGKPSQIFIFYRFNIMTMLQRNNVVNISKALPKRWWISRSLIQPVPCICWSIHSTLRKRCHLTHCTFRYETSANTYSAFPWMPALESARGR